MPQWVNYQALAMAMLTDYNYLIAYCTLIMHLIVNSNSISSPIVVH